MRIVRAAGWLLEHIGHIYLAAMAATVAASVLLLIGLAVWSAF